MVEQSTTQILICPNHGPMSNRNASQRVGPFGVAVSTCPDCGLELVFVDIEELEVMQCNPLNTHNL